jgi:NADP-dependent 3-hydroxy acid dehydrogenase YdfG
MGWFAPLNPPLTDWAGRSVWLVGASSGIGEALARELSARGARVAISARNAQALQALAQALPGVRDWPLDVCDPASVRSAAVGIAQEQGLDVVVYCAGHYLAQSATAFDVGEMQRHWHINVDGASQVLAEVLPPLLAQRHGHLALVASVAGYRGLPKALAYGPTKAALRHLADVLYIDLHAQGIGVSVINPGFVQTPLTAQNTFEMPALISPAEAARAICAGWSRGEFEIHFPKRFTWVMKALSVLPHRWYFAVMRWVVKNGA